MRLLFLPVIHFTQKVISLYDVSVCVIKLIPTDFKIQNKTKQWTSVFRIFVSKVTLEISHSFHSKMYFYFIIIRMVNYYVAKRSERIIQMETKNSHSYKMFLFQRLRTGFYHFCDSVNTAPPRGCSRRFKYYTEHTARQRWTSNGPSPKNHWHHPTHMSTTETFDSLCKQEFESLLCVILKKSLIYFQQHWNTAAEFNQGRVLQTL